VLDKPPQIVVSKQWQNVEDWQHMHNFLVTLILIRNYNYCASTFCVLCLNSATCEEKNLWRPAWCNCTQCPILQEMDYLKNCLRHQYSHFLHTHSYKYILFCFKLKILVWVLLKKLKFSILWNNQQMQLYAVNFIPPLSSLYIF